MLTTTEFQPEFKHSKFEDIISANDQVNVALIGCRNMGWANLSDFLKHSNVICVALCYINRKILDSPSKELQHKYNQKTEQCFEPGSKVIRISPNLGDLEFAEGTFPTPFGIVSVKHIKQPDGSILSDVDAPEEVKIELKLN